MNAVLNMGNTFRLFNKRLGEQPAVLGETGDPDGHGKMVSPSTYHIDLIVGISPVTTDVIDGLDKDTTFMAA